MKTSIRLLVASLLLLPLTAVAQSPPIVAAAPEVCANIKWNVSFLERYPKAPAACRGVEVRAGLSTPSSWAKSPRRALRLSK